MTGKFVDWRRAACGSAAGIAMAAGLAFGSAGITHADPTTSPAPTPSSSAGPATAPSAVPTPTPKPTVAVEGGAAAAATPTASAAGSTSGDVLDQLAEEYAVGAGGGQLSNLLKTSLKLRSMGFKPSKQYLDELQTAMKYRPNQLPLIEALKDTIAYQQKLMAQTDILTKAQSQQNAGSAVMGAGQMPGASNPANLAPQSGAQSAAGAPAPPVMVPAPPTP